MKAVTLFVVLLVTNFSFAQDIEDRDDSFISENNKNLLKIEIKEPFKQIIDKNCKYFKAATFKNGATAYKDLLKKYMYNYLNPDFYTLSGEFIFTLTIDDVGKVIDVKGMPKVSNSELFFDDMNYIVRRIKKNWAPATCNSQPIKSEMKLKMNFTSLSADM